MATTRDYRAGCGAGRAAPCWNPGFDHSRPRRSSTSRSHDVTVWSRGAIRPSVANSCARSRAQGTPGACCTRGLVCKMHKGKRTRAYRYSRSIPASLRNGLTTYAVLSPATNSSCHRHRRMDDLAAPGWARKISADLTPATGARTTRFCRTQLASTKGLDGFDTRPPKLERRRIWRRSSGAR